MALTTQQQAEKSYKKIVHGKSTSGDGTKDYFLEDNSPIHTNSENIRTEWHKIPLTAPSTPTVNDIFDENGVKQGDLGFLTPIIQYKEETASKILGTDNSYIVSGESNIIKFSDFGGVYAPIIEDNLGANIPFGTGSGELDTDVGVFTFFDTVAFDTSSIPSLTIKYWKYVGNDLKTSLENATLSNNQWELYTTTTEPNIAYASGVFTITHNYNSQLIHFILKQNTSLVLPHDFVFVDDNTIEVHVQPINEIPTSSPSNLVLTLIKLA